VTARRPHPATVALVVLAAVAWWAAVVRMADMDGGPGTELGALGWFTVTWAVMMAAMMLPSLAPTAVAYAAPAGRRGYGRTLEFAAGYLLVWAVVGIGAYALFGAGRRVLGGALAWDTGGQAVAAGVLALAALYEATPLKRTCLAACREPLRMREGWRGGALAAGIRAGGWCVGCSWALMASLFALGVMSLTWMALVASVVALQKSVVALHGDYYGETVNVAARLVALAQPSRVAVDEEVRRRASCTFAFRRFPAQPLKGLPDAAAYLAARPSS
jgi:predicted metal-binding membrane protein